MTCMCEILCKVFAIFVGRQVCVCVSRQMNGKNFYFLLLHLISYKKNTVKARHVTAVAIGGKSFLSKARPYMYSYSRSNYRYLALPTVLQVSYILE